MNPPGLWSSRPHHYDTKSKYFNHRGEVRVPLAFLFLVRYLVECLSFGELAEQAGGPFALCNTWESGESRGEFPKRCMCAFWGGEAWGQIAFGAYP